MGHQTHRLTDGLGGQEMIERIAVQHRQGLDGGRVGRGHRQQFEFRSAKCFKSITAGDRHGRAFACGAAFDCDLPDRNGADENLVGVVLEEILCMAGQAQVVDHSPDGDVGVQ